MEKYCGRDLVDRIPTIDLAAPPAAVGFDSKNIISSDDDVLVIVRGNTWHFPDFEVVTAETSEPVEWAIEDVEDQMCLCLSGLPAGEFAVHLRDQNLATLHVLREPPKTPQIAEIRLVTASHDDGRDINSPLHSSDAMERWAALFNGTETWRRISIPKGVALALTWRRAGSHEKVRPELSTAEDVAEAFATCRLMAFRENG